MFKRYNNHIYIFIVVVTMKMLKTKRDLQTELILVKLSIVVIYFEHGLRFPKINILVLKA